jgi:hypothetical protein
MSLSEFELKLTVNLKKQEFLNRELELLSKANELLNEEFIIRSKLIELSTIVNTSTSTKTDNLKCLSRLPTRSDTNVLDSTTKSLSQLLISKNVEEDDDEFDYNEYLMSDVRKHIEREKEEIAKVNAGYPKPPSPKLVSVDTDSDTDVVSYHRYSI